MELGGKYMEYCEKTQQLKYLYVEVEFREEFDQEWIRIQKWKNDVMSSSADGATEEAVNDGAGSGSGAAAKAVPKKGGKRKAGDEEPEAEENKRRRVDKAPKVYVSDCFCTVRFGRLPIIICVRACLPCRLFIPFLYTPGESKYKQLLAR